MVIVKRGGGGFAAIRIFGGRGSVYIIRTSDKRCSYCACVYAAGIKGEADGKAITR